MNCVGNQSRRRGECNSGQSASHSELQRWHVSPRPWYADLAKTPTCANSATRFKVNAAIGRGSGVGTGCAPPQRAEPVPNLERETSNMNLNTN
jgi:hypothetical protein